MSSSVVALLPGSTASPAQAVADPVGRQDDEKGCGQRRADEEGHQVAAVLASKPHVALVVVVYDNASHMYMFYISLPLLAIEPLLGRR